MDINQHKAILIIADISGYTNFMLANRKTISKSHKIIIELITTIIEHLELPLEVAKIEGDAVFLYILKGEDENEWNNVNKNIGDKLITFFDVFTLKINELRNSVLCEGDVCLKIESLKLKVIVHSGFAELVKINNFIELSGIDVIIIHRLLKNSVQSKEYILMTESACNDIMFPRIICIETSVELIEDIGEIKTFIYYHNNSTSIKET